MNEKKLKGEDDYKFLGKEVAYYDGLFRLWLAIMNSVAKGEDVTNLVNHLEASFPYKDDDYKKEIDKIQTELNKGINAKDKFGRFDTVSRNKAITEFTMKKYQLLIELFKRKRVLPHEAEEEWM